MLAAKHKLIAALALALLLSPVPALADIYLKINDIWVGEDGRPEVFATALNEFGRAPEMSDYQKISLFFGEANQFDSGENLDVVPFEEAEIPTDYVLIVPGYAGFGRNNSIAACEGAGWFQNAMVGENDTAVVLLYGDGVLLHEGNAAELAEAMGEPDGIAQVARPYMLSALDEAVRLFDQMPQNRRRIIILVGSGLDVRLASASQVQLPDNATESDYAAAWRSVLREHQNILRGYIESVESVNAHIYALGFNETREDYLEVLNVLARKTNGTFRRVPNIGLLSAVGGDASTGAYGLLANELKRELVMRPDIELEAEREYEVWTVVELDRGSQTIVEEGSRVYYLTVEPYQTGFNIIPFLILIGVIIIIVVFMVIYLIGLIKKMKKRRKAIEERKALEETVAAGALYCKTCYRVMQPEWEHCLFCASGMEPLPEKPQAMLDAEEAQKKLNELDGLGEPEPEVVVGTAGAVAVYAAQTGQYVCNNCGRVMAPEWTECLFCAAEVGALPDQAPAPQQGEVAVPVAFGPSGAPPAAAAPAAAAAGGGQQDSGYKTVAIAPGTANCPECQRPIPEGWTECLYCKAGV